MRKEDKPFGEDEISEEELREYLAHVRRVEALGKMQVDTPLAEYERDFNGLDATLDYVRDHTDSKVVAIVGADTGVAANELADNESQRTDGRNLTVVATGLLRPQNYSGSVPYFETSGEYLEGLPTVGGVIAKSSITYTRSPRRVVMALDRILSPGGVIETYLSPYYAALHARMGIFVSTQDDFLPLLRAKGYDVATSGLSILVAIKPGNTSGITAADLLARNKQSYLQKKAQS
jgi:hypothetical protein